MAQYEIKVAVHSGLGHVVEVTGDVPDGVFVISGHDDSPQTRSIGVAHSDHSGGLVASVGGTHAKTAVHHHHDG